MSGSCRCQFPDLVSVNARQRRARTLRQHREAAHDEHGVPCGDTSRSLHINQSPSSLDDIDINHVNDTEARRRRCYFLRS